MTGVQTCALPILQPFEAPPLPLLAWAQASAGFDHASTGFALQGSHEPVRCETCHLNAVFKGTPRDCGTCHMAGNPRGALAKPFRHVPTGDSCDSCHGVTTFSGARVAHGTVAPGSCANCHNGVSATGKPPNHFPTTLSCDKCHSPFGFSPAVGFDHSLLNGDTSSCATCHDGQNATGMPSNHLPVGARNFCANCHAASIAGGFVSFAGGRMDHTGFGSGCVACHGPTINGATFAGIRSIVVMPPVSPVGWGSHLPSGTTCETCHLASMPAGLVDANATRLAPGSGFEIGRAHV